jgi:hypothetical protein
MIVGTERSAFVHLVICQVPFIVATDIPLVSGIGFGLFSIWHAVPSFQCRRSLRDVMILHIQAPSPLFMIGTSVA